MEARLLYNRIDNFQTQTLEAVTAQEFIQSKGASRSPEERMDFVLDEMNIINRVLEENLPSVQSLLDDIVSEIPSHDERGLFYLKNKLEANSNVIGKLVKVMKSSTFTDAFSKMAEEYEVLYSDLCEIISDIDKKVKGNKKIESLLSQLEEF